MKVRVLVVDDHEVLRQGLVTVLTSDDQIEVIGQATDGPEAVRLAQRLRPDVVLMDVEMAGGDGISATREITAALPDTRVLVLTMFDLDEYVVEALRAGASGYLLKTTPPADLLRAVSACAQGQSTIASHVLERVVRPLLGAPQEPVPGLADLTDRELDVLRSLAAGRSNAEISRELYLAETTVKTHVAHILTKLGVRDRLQAAVAAHRAGLLS
ncbi:MAG: response regulator transcription factor [Nocardioides sp.]|uniref:response regulator n=1 Tax=Nocardioides sp. TaxID=35761 RepID=UPI0039E6EF44